MNRQQVTRYTVTVQVVVTLVVIVSVIVTDVLLLTGVIGPAPAIEGLEGQTYSEVTRYLSQWNPILAWAWGLFAGRFFHWDRQRLLRSDAATASVMVGLTALVVVVWGGLLAHLAWQPIASAFGMTLVFAAAYVVGALFWPVPSGGVFFADAGGRRRRAVA